MRRSARSRPSPTSPELLDESRAAGMAVAASASTAPDVPRASGRTGVPRRAGRPDERAQARARRRRRLSLRRRPATASPSRCATRLPPAGRGGRDPGRRDRPRRARRAGRAGRRATEHGPYRRRRLPPAAPGCRGRDPDPRPDRRRRRARARGAVDDPRRAPRTSRWSPRPPTAARSRGAVDASGPTSCSWTSGCRRWTGSPRPRRCARANAPQVIVLTTFDADEYVLRRAARGRQRLPAQGHAAGGDRPGDPARRRRRGDAVAGGDAAADRPRRRPGVDAPPAAPRAARRGSPSASARSRSRSAAGARTPRSPPSST